jgi:hypothetical protein
MAPKAKKAPQVRGQQGLQSFFGGSKGAAPASNTAPSVAPAQTSKDAPVEAPKAPSIAETATTAATPNVEIPKESKTAREPLAELTAKPVQDSKAPVSETPTSGGLTDAQKQRIEENKQKALERRGLSDAQKKQIEENKQKALERRQQKIKVDSSAAEQTNKASNSKKESDESNTTAGKRLQVTDEDHVTPSKKPCLDQKKDSDISPEKLERRISSTQLSSSQGPEEMFRTFGRVSWMQYNSLYSVRLDKLRGIVDARARSLWSKELGANSFLSHVTAGSIDVQGDVVAVGILYKDLKSRDNVIEKYQSSQMCGTMPEDFMDRQENLCSDSDVLWLEDRVSRIELELPQEQIAKLSTGFVVGVRGRNTAKGKLHVTDICFPASTTVPASIPAGREETALGPYIACVSG